MRNICMHAYKGLVSDVQPNEKDLANKRFVPRLWYRNVHYQHYTHKQNIQTSLLVNSLASRIMLASLLRYADWTWVRDRSLITSRGGGVRWFPKKMEKK